MHEVAIAQSLIAAIEKERALRGSPAVIGVGVRIGALSDINPESLVFGYQCLVADTSLAGCELSIERIPAVGKCRLCNTTNQYDNLVFICPDCGSSAVELVSGQELEIAWLNIEETCETPGGWPRG